MQINQLEDNVLILRQKADKTDECIHEITILKDDILKKTNEVNSLQEKLNENYRLVAGLSSENLKLSSEKLKADDLVSDVIKEQTRLKQELQKAVQVVDAIKESDQATKNRQSSRNRRNNNTAAYRTYNINSSKQSPNIFIIII